MKKKLVYLLVVTEDVITKRSIVLPSVIWYNYN